MKWSAFVAAATLVIALGSEARSQPSFANFNYDESSEVLIDKVTGKEWQCGRGLQWSYETYFPSSFEQAKALWPGVYSAGPYGDGGGWRMATTAELQNALNKGLFQALVAVAQYQRAKQLEADPTLPESELIVIPQSWWPSWVEGKANKRFAYYVVLGSGQSVQVLRENSYLYVLYVR